MIGFRELNNDGTNGSKFTISGSGYLDLNISIDNIEVLENTSRLLVGDSIESKRLIFKDATGAGATKKLAGRKLCSLGDAKSHSVFINSKERLNQYTNLATLAASMAEINAQKQNSKQTKKDNNKKELSLIHI